MRLLELHCLNGMAASDKIFDLLDMPPVTEQGTKTIQHLAMLHCTCFLLQRETVLVNVSFGMRANSLNA